MNIIFLLNNGAKQGQEWRTLFDLLSQVNSVYPGRAYTDILVAWLDGEKILLSPASKLEGSSVPYIYRKPIDTPPGEPAECVYQAKGTIILDSLIGQTRHRFPGVPFQLLVVTHEDGSYRVSQLVD